MKESLADKIVRYEAVHLAAAVTRKDIVYFTTGGDSGEDKYTFEISVVANESGLGNYCIGTLEGTCLKEYFGYDKIPGVICVGPVSDTGELEERNVIRRGKRCGFVLPFEAHSEFYTAPVTIVSKMKRDLFV